MSALIFLLSLPVAVYTYACCFAPLDQVDKSRALLGLSVRLALLVALLLLIDESHQIWVWLAFSLVAFLHLGAFALSRWLIGRKSFLCESIE